MMRKIELIQIMPAPEGLAVIWENEKARWYSKVYCFGLYKEISDGTEITFVSPIPHQSFEREDSHGMYPVVDDNSYLMTCDVRSAMDYCLEGLTKSARQKILSLIWDYGGAYCEPSRS